MDSATTSGGGSSEHKSFSQISRDRLLFEMLGGTKSGWKVLITDKVTLKVLSHSCKMADITDQEVSLVEDILKRREPLPSMDVVYFIEPTKLNVSIITCELSGKEPLYRNANIFFSSIVTQEIIHQIQGIQGALSRISAVKAMNLEYFPVDSQAFTTDQDMAMEELFGNIENTTRFNTCLNVTAARLATVFASLKELPHVWYRAAKESEQSTARDLAPSKLADQVWDIISKYKTSIPNFPQSETCELLIVDRSIDQIAPIIHEWTYDAMCRDLLVMDGNKYTYEVPSKAGGAPEKKEALLGEHDSVWLEIRHAHIADASERLSDKMDNFVAKNKAAQIHQSGRDGSELSTRDLQKMVQALPDYTEKMEKISLHVEIAGKINKIIRETGLRELGQLEQDLVFGDAGSKEVINFLRATQDATVENKLRLLMIYAIVYPEKFEGEKATKLMQLAKLSTSDMKAISNMKMLAGSSGNKSSSSANFSLKFSNQKKNNAARKDRADEGETWQLFRFFPMLEELIENLNKGDLAKSGYSCKNQPSPPTQVSSKVGQRPQTTTTTNPHAVKSRRTANWGRSRLSDDGSSSDSALKNADNDSKKMGKRIFVFIIGGATRSEIRVCHKMTAKLKREVILGSSSIINPPEYITKLKLLLEE
ncbi:hypothetical protein K1719_038194 [Acacia pycnantha]|nr:hypothetical protein K1719_038194 [Acacia pycnantha]